MITAAGIEEQHDIRIFDGVSSSKSIKMFAAEDDGNCFMDALEFAGAGPAIDDEFSLLSGWLAEIVDMEEDEDSEEGDDGPGPPSDDSVDDDDEPDAEDDDNSEPEEPPMTELQKLLVDLNLSLVGDVVSRFYEVGGVGAPIGKLTCVCVGEPYVRCECKAHTGCILFYSTRANFNHKWLAAIRWVEEGARLSTQAHADAATAVKRSFGIKPRARS